MLHFKEYLDKLIPFDKKYMYIVCHDSTQTDLITKALSNEHKHIHHDM